MSFLSCLLAGFAILILIPVAVFFCEVAASLLPRSRAAPAGRRPRFAILVPAHDEHLLIARTAAGIIPELAAGDRLIVIADNCSDDTGLLAERAGAEVIHRTDPKRRGKSYALDYGVRHLEADPPEVVIIVDADCSVSPGALAAIAMRAAQAGRPVQAHYMMELPPGQHPGSLVMAAFAWRVKGLVRATGLQRLGLPCQLMGSGMAFPWAVLSSADLRNSEVVEDLVLGLQLAREGRAPEFFSDARVLSYFPETAEGRATQQVRWEGGHLNVIARRVPSLLLEAVRTANLPLLVLVADAAVPPLAFLALSVAAGTLLTICAWMLGVGLAPLLLSILSAALLTIAVLVCWWRAGRDIVSLTTLVCAPLYVLSKIALYGGVLIGRQIGWVRTKRG